VFQALVAAAAARWNERIRLDYAVPALEWLERRPPPDVVATAGDKSDVKYRLYVPDNTGDLAASAWSRGDTTRIVKRTEKTVRSTHLLGDAVHYLYPVAEGDPELDRHLGTLQAAARSITHLGWGIDMVVGDAKCLTDAEADTLPGERWRPADGAGGDGLRVPIDGTLADLSRKHADFLNRLSTDGFKPVPPLTAFRVVGYRRATEPAPRLRWAAYRIISADPDGRNPAYDTPRRARDVAAWVRHAAGRVCADWPDVASYVHGHDPADSDKPIKGDLADNRLWYLPLPTINPALNRVESIRRVIVAAPVPDSDRRFEKLRRLLAGQELTYDDRSFGILVPLTGQDWVRDQYVRSATVWSTVTPVVWPGHDDHDARKAEQVLRKAFVQAGLPHEVVDGIAELDWRNVGFRPGVDLACRYRRPDKLSGRLSHVRVQFRRPIPGPLAIGAGRYRGLGLFAAEGQ
jgi:CRISPR-associated protein Csb2